MLIKNGEPVLCSVCKKKDAINAHHTNYEHLGEPDLEVHDLIALCKLCHSMHHGKVKQSKSFKNKRNKVFGIAKRRRKVILKVSSKIFSWNRIQV